MREIERIDRILELIKTIWDKYPDWRFGQLLINIGLVDDSIRVWRNEDKGTEEYLKEYIKQNE